MTQILIVKPFWIWDPRLHKQEDGVLKLSSESYIIGKYMI
jgi:hypothetical protein